MTHLKNLLKKGKISLLAGDNDEWQLFFFLFIYLLAWTLPVGLLPLSMYRDSVEEVVWSQTWQWGYYKHPPLPSILISGLNHLFGGPSMWLTIFAAQGCNAIALIYVWRLAKQVLPHKLAIVAVLITSLIGYHNFRAVVFDHNTVSLPFTAATWYYFYCAIRHPERISTWLILGIAGGLAMLTKYSAILVFASAFVYVIWQHLWLNLLVIRGLLVSILAFTFVFSPHVIWLVNHDWLPFTYLANQLTTSDSRLTILSEFFIGQGFRFWYVFVAVWFLSKISPRKLMIQNAPKSHVIDDDWCFLLITLFTPLILALLPLLINGHFLSINWVTAFFLPTGIVLIKCFFCQYDEDQLLQNTHRVVWPIQVIILLIFLSVTVFYPALSGYAVKFNFPSQLLAERVSTIWHEHQRQPLTIVISDTWMGGNVLLHTRPEPALLMYEPTLLINNESAISPWVNLQDVENCGALVLTTIAEKDLPFYSTLFSQATATGTFLLNWGHTPHEETVKYAWAILSPESNHNTCRFDVV
jgi:4-amino-4-deoxy-L-arabinose transferase-like glycosyltransferase